MSPSIPGSKRLLAGAVCAMVLFVPASTLAQNAPRLRAGAGVAATLLVGDASDFLDGSLGLFLTADIRVDRRDIVGLHIDASWGGLEDAADPLAGTRATNDLLIVVGGPEIRGSVGRLRPYAAALAGAATVFWKTTGPSADDEGSGAAFAWGGHAGLGFVLDAGRHPVTLSADARVLDAGTLPFGRTHESAGGEPLGLSREDVALLSLRIGLSVGF